MKNRKIRYAVAGLGYIAQAAVLPAFAHARKNSELAALISDDELKLRKLGKRYGVKALYRYDQYEECLNGGEIDAVYIALPNAMHREYTLRAAVKGVHVLCEKPMALKVGECAEMIEACEIKDVRLMIAYRLHFDAANLQAIKAVRSGKIGEPRVFQSAFTMQVKPEGIRVQRELGGGPLLDIGIYCVNAARYLFGDEPVQAFAMRVNNGEPRFNEIDEAVSACLRFPRDRLASFTVSFGASDVSSYQVIGTRGDLRVESAYEIATKSRHVLTVDGRVKERAFPKHDQFAPELIYFSECVLKGRDPEPSGREGMADVRVINALEKSMETGKAVLLREFGKTARPGENQEMTVSPVKEPNLVHAESPFYH